MVESFKRVESMFSLGRKLDVAKTFFVRPIAFYTTDSRTGFAQLDVVKKEEKKVFVPEKLEETFKSAIDPLQVLSSLPSNASDAKTLPNDAVVDALRTIATLQKANAKTIKPQFITSHPNFEVLCRRLQLCSPMFTPNELITSIKCLYMLGVPKNSEIFLVLLHLLRHEINYLNINEIIFLVFLLGRTQSQSNLEEAIKSALTKVFNQNIPQEVDVNTSVDNLVKILNFMAQHKKEYMKDNNIKKVCRLLGDKKDEISSQNALNIIHHLCALNRFQVGNVIRLMNISIRLLIHKSNEVNVHDLVLVAQRLVSIAKDNMFSFQSLIHGFLRSCGERIAREDLGIEAAVHLLSVCKKISYRNIALLEYIGNEIASKPENCRTMELTPLFSIVQGFANNSFIPRSEDKSIWHETILPAILENHLLAQVPQNSNVWMKFTLQLMTLGHFDQSFVHRVLSTQYLDNYFKSKKLNMLDMSKVLILYQTASMHPKIDISCVQQSAIDDLFQTYAFQAQSSDTYGVALREILEEYAIGNVRTKHLHLISTLVKVKKSTMLLEPFPSEILRDDNGFALIDDIPCDSDEILVCVDALQRYSMVSNISRKRLWKVFDDNKIGMYRLRSQQLNQLGVALCEINCLRLDNLYPEKKHEYVFNSIVDAVNEIQNV